ncbi:P-type conjugative transfer protein TrbL [Bradyrhizobium sp. i1.3.1]
MKKTVYIGFVAFNTLSGVIFNSFAGLGLKAGGSSISTPDFLRPGRLAQVGLDAGAPTAGCRSQMMGFTSFFAVAVLMVSWLLVLIAFFILAVQLFVTLIEFKLTTLAGFILIPFRPLQQDCLSRREGAGQCRRLQREDDGARCHRRHRRRTVS